MDGRGGRQDGKGGGALRTDCWGQRQGGEGKLALVSYKESILVGLVR